MKIIGDRVLLERVEQEKAEGFEAVQVMDDFVCKGRVVQVGLPLSHWPMAGNTILSFTGSSTMKTPEDDLAIGNIVLFAKFSPDTQEVKVDGKDMKSVAFSDIIAIL